MVTMDCAIKLRNARHCRRIDTMELKDCIVKKLGPQLALKYFNLVSRYLSLRLRKTAFDKMCIGLLGRENVSLHNGLIRAIVKNVCAEDKSKFGRGRSSSNVKNSFGFRRGKSSIRSKDRLSPLGPSGGKLRIEDLAEKFPEQQSATEMFSLGSRPPVDVNSVEDGEEVEQDAGSPGIYSRTALKAPLGVYFRSKNELCLGSSALGSTDTCYYNGGLPDFALLRKRLECISRLNVSTDCVNLMNNGVDVFLKRLLKPCLDLASVRAEEVSVSVTNFRVVAETSPSMLGENWPVQLEKVCLHALEGAVDDA
ncbi:uncharacterized protein LOC127257809 [Andrographis paniculata]|uniref:uncharacterized protein LOC127257809 n=1 Tax=Andrographis paniculata TaxID=175694 RepID=UPI0021E98096|nr:uncharacterized protein LOC127257809 [Andrographis paniculata]